MNTAHWLPRALGWFVLGLVLVVPVTLFFGGVAWSMSGAPSISSVPTWLNDAFAGQPAVYCVREGQRAEFIMNTYVRPHQTTLERDFGQAGLTDECYTSDTYSFTKDDRAQRPDQVARLHPR